MVSSCNSCEKKANDAETGATVNLSKKNLSGAILALGLLPLGYLCIGHSPIINQTFDSGWRNEARLCRHPAPVFVEKMYILSHSF